MRNEHDYTPDSGLRRFIADARRFPMLGAEEERELARRWHRDGDEQALEKLIGSHLRLVIKRARKKAGYGLPLGDLVAEGNHGLMQAALKFDPERGFRFATYAIWWVEAAMQDYVMRNWSIVRIGTSAAQKRLFFKLRQKKAALGDVGGGVIDHDVATAIAVDLGVDVDEVRAMDGRLASPDNSLNAPIGAEGDAEFQDILVDEETNPEHELIELDETLKRRAMLDDALHVLNDRERDILIQRRLTEDRPTLGDLSEKYGVSRERIRQIETRALDKLKEAVIEGAHAPAPGA